LHIQAGVSPKVPLGLRDVAGLPLDTGHGAVPRFDGLIADNVLSFFSEMGDQGIPVRLRDGFRTRQMQTQAHQKYRGASPGNGLHEAGLAFDVNWENLTPSQRQAVVRSAQDHGFQWGGNFKPVDARHFFVDPFDGLSERQAYIRDLQGSR
jgi:hypothetical protein